jgi:hypothetical protein
MAGPLRQQAPVAEVNQGSTTGWSHAPVRQQAPDTDGSQGSSHGLDLAVAGITAIGSDMQGQDVQLSSPFEGMQSAGATAPQETGESFKRAAFSKSSSGLYM